MSGHKRDQHFRMLRRIGVSYAVDIALLAAFAAAGTVGWHVLALFVLAGCATMGTTALAVRNGWNELWHDEFLVLPQICAHGALVFALAWWVPQIGVLVLTTVFVVGAFPSLHMRSREIVIAVALLAAEVIGLVLAHGDRLGMPLATPVERVISGVWLATVLARCMMVGLYGAKLRQSINRKREELANANRQLELLATHDVLTGTLNRRAILARIEQAREVCLRGGAPFALGLLDIDHFKRVNDTLGHVKGDEALCRFVAEVGAQLRCSDQLGRYGGEEFVVLLQGPLDAASALRLAERLHRGVEAADWTDIAPGLHLTTSVGVAVFDGSEAVVQTLARADRALYAAKAAGRNRCVAAA